MGYNNGYESGYEDGFAAGVLKAKRASGAPAGNEEIFLDSSNFLLEVQDGTMVGIIELDVSTLGVGGCVVVRDNNKTPHASYYGGANLRMPSGITKVFNNGQRYNDTGETFLESGAMISYVGGDRSGKFCMMIYRTTDTLYAVYCGDSE